MLKRSLILLGDSCPKDSKALLFYDEGKGSQMLNRIFSKKPKLQNEDIVNAVVTQTSALINDLHRQIDFRFKELSAQVKEVELGLAQMETKLLTKDLKDKQAYGLLHYKLHEAKNPKLNDEIQELERALSIKKML